MTVPRCDRNLLLVEGVEERFLIPELVEKAGRIEWGDWKQRLHPVEIRSCGGASNLLDRDRIVAVLNTPGLETVAVVIDANGDVASRWQQVRDRFVAQFPLLPIEMPAAGLIESNAARLRLGVWIMPDNQRMGMLESLLCDLIRQDQMPVFEHAKQATAQAQAIPAPFSNAHLTKAQVHTWLAWQDPPGLQLHEAVMKRILDPASPFAQPFVEWFIRLFQLDDLRRPVAPP